MTVNYIKRASILRIPFAALVLVLLGMTNGYAQGASITLTFSFIQPSCNGFSDGTATVTPSGGVAPYTFLWNNNQQASTIQNITSGNYAVTVTDNSGQTAAGSVQVTDPSPLQANVVTSFPSCNGSSGAMIVAVSGGTAPYTTIWSNGIVGPVGTGLLPGVQYTAASTDAKGCQLITPVTVSEIDSLNVGITTSWAACPGIDNGVATALVTPPGGLYQYSWNISNQNAAQITGIAGNTQVAVTVTDQNSGCTGTASGVVVWHVQLALNINNVAGVVCAYDTTGTASAIASKGTAPYSYAWSGPDGATYAGANLSGLSAGIYTVTATDGGGCTITGTASVRALSDPQAAFSLQQECENNLISFQINDISGDTASTIVTWDWTINDSITSTGKNPPAFTMPNSTPGNIQLVVISAVGCVDTALFDFVAKAFPDVTVQTPGFTCDGSAVPIKVNGSPNLTYTWIPPDGITYNPDSRTVLADPDSTTVYILIVSDSSCFDTIKSIKITRQELNITAACNAVQHPNCGLNNGIAGVTASGGTAPYTYLWNTGAVTPTVTGLVGGAYTVTVTDANNCTATCSVTLIPTGELPANCNVDQQPNCGLDNGAVSVSASGGAAPYTYLWNTGAVTPALTGLGGGTYTVTVTDANGCTGTCSVTLTPISGVTANCSVVQQPTCGLNNGIITVSASGCTPPYGFQWSTGDITQTVSNLGPGTYTVTVTSADGFTATCSVTLNPSSAPTATCNAVQQPTCGLNNGIVSVTAGGGTAPYTYLWNTGAVTPTVTGLGGGAYTVTVTDANNCTATCSVTLVPSDGLTADCAADQQPNCGLDNGAVSVDASGGTAPYTYLWNTGAVTPALTGLGGGTYTVTVTDANGCTGTCSVTLTPISGVTANCSVVQQPTCGLNNGIITVSASGCTPPYGFLWSTGDTIQTVSNLGPGTYTVTVTSADGFTATCSVTLNPSSAPTATCNADQQPSCGLNNGIVSVTASGGTAPYTYLWNTGAVTPTVTGLGGGTYTVTVTDANNCTATCSVTLVPSDGLTANCAADQQPTCGLDNGAVSVSASGGTAPYTYLWNTGAVTPALTGRGGGTYTVTVTDANGCTGTCSVSLTPISGVTANCSVVQQPTCGLNNGIITVSASGCTPPYGFQWSTGDITQTVSNLGPGTYTVTVTSADGFTATCSVTLNPSSAPTATCNADQQPTCGLNNGIVSVTASGGTAPYTYLWNTGAVTPTVTGLGGGTYTVTVTDANNCTATCSVTLVPSDGLTANCAADQQPTCGLDNGAVSVSASGGAAPYTYLWNTGAVTPALTGRGGGTYTVTVTDANGCTGTCSVSLTPISGVTANCSVVQQPTCGLNNGIITVSASGCTPPYGFQWNTGDITQTVSNLGPGTYTVTVTSADGFTATCSVTLNPSSAPTATCNADQQPSCGLNNGIVSVTASSGTAPYTYLWNTGAVTPTVTGLGGGTYTVTVTDANNCTATCSVTLVPSDGLTANCAADQQPNCGLDNGAVSVDASGGAAPYTYLWNTGAVTPALTGLGGGTYTVTVTDANGCTGTCSVTLTPISGVTANCSVVQQPTCGLNNGIITVSASGCTPPYGFLWSTGDTIQTVSNLGPGTYTVTVTSADGFTATCSVTLNPSSAPTATCNADQQPSCGLNNGIVSVTASGGTAPYTYLWNTGAVTPTVTGLGGGTYTVTVTDANNCTATCSVTLTPTDGLTANCAADQQPNCGLDNGAVSVDASGGVAPYTYLWNTGAVTPALTGLGGGTYTVTVTDANGCTGTCSVTLTPISGVTANCSVVQQPTCGLNNGIITVSASGCTPPYGFLWSTGDTIQTASNLGPGTYTVTVTSADGFTATCSVTLNPSSAPTATCNADQQPSCGLNNGIVSVTASGGTAPYTYLWNTGAVTPTVTGLGGGTYTVTVTDANNCTATCSVTLTPISGVTANCSVVQQPTCGLNNGIITVSASGCTPPYGFLWSTGDTIQTVSNLGPGTYTVTVTSADGFTASCSVTLNPSTGPTATCNADQQPSCGLNNGIVSVTAGGGTAPYTYLWNTGAVTPTVTGLGGGTYTVTVTDANNCTATCSVTLTPISGVTANCSVVQQPTCGLNNGIITVSASGCTPPYGFLWSTGDTIQTVSNLGPGTYTVTVTSADGFTATCSVTLNPSTGPTATCNADQQPTCGLNNGIVSVTASGGTAPYTYLWNTGAVTPTVTGLGGGVYTVTVTDANNCTATCSVTLTPGEGPNVTAASNSPVCEGAEIGLTSNGAGGTPPYTFNWTGPAGFSASEQNPVRTGATVPMGGIYIVTVTDANGCTGTASTTVVVHPAPSVSASSNSPVCEGDTIRLNGVTAGGTAPYVISWSGPDGFVSDIQNPEIPNATEAMNGIYVFRATDANGCSDSMMLSVVVAAVAANGIVPANACAPDEILLTALNLNPGDTVFWSSEPGTLEISDPTAPVTTASGPGGQYTVSLQVVNAAGCRADTSFTLNIISVNVSVEVVGKDTICSGEEAPLLASASGNSTGYTYSWSPAGTLDNSSIPNPVASPNGQETYTVTVTGDNGCSATGSVTVYFMETQCRDPYIFVPKAFTPNGDNNNDRFRVRGTNITELLFIVYDRWGEEVYRTEDPEHEGWDGTFRGEPSTPDSYGWYLRVRCGDGQIFENKGNVTLFK